MIVLEARDVSKSFWIPDEHRDTIREHVLAAFRRRPLRELPCCGPCRSRCRRVSHSG